MDEAHEGSSFFWLRSASLRISIWAGSFDRSTGLRIERHIFAASKGDYYEIVPGALVFPESD